MRILILLILMVSFCIGCSKGDTPEKEPAVKSLPFDGDFQELEAAQLPENIRSEGKLIRALSYEDVMGSHQLTIYQTGPLQDPQGEDALMAALQMALYRDGKSEPVWAYAIAERNCPFDLWVGIDTITITDLDKNGAAELGLVISHCCRSDVSPAQMQVLLHQKDQTYRLSGDHWLPMFGAFPTPESYAMTSLKDSTAYEIEHDLPARWGRFRVVEAPVPLAGVLREHARMLWRSQVIEQEFRSLSLED